ncbi:PQQ-binding-like beta-propeller repeat protein, partial [Verrucomicrobiota bacterium]
MGPFLIVLGAAGPALGDDWPVFGHDNRRSCISEERLPVPLSTEWVFKAPYPPSHAWPDPQPKPVENNLELPRLRFDDAFQVVAAGDAVFFGSSSDTKVYALDAKTGTILWEFYTEGPVRLAPTLWEEKLYVGSDDGCVYCLNADDGSLVWRFRAAPGPDKVLGNGRMISLWPVRTGITVDQGIAYCGAGIFPGEGLRLYALDARKGTVLWRNDSYGQGGSADITPQGYLLMSKDKIFMPCGRAMPVAFSRADGRLLYHRNLNWRANGLFGGTYALLAGNMLYTGTEQIHTVNTADGGLVASDAVRRLIVTPERVFTLSGESAMSAELSKWPAIRTVRTALHKTLRMRTGLEAQLAHVDRQLATTGRAAADTARRGRLMQFKAGIETQLTSTSARCNKLEQEMATALETAATW